MNAPFINTGAIELDFGLVLTVLLGIGFGFSLERAGFGSSRKLAGQFYLFDMTVFKVMFTAILTAMIGLFGLVKLGFMDLDLTYINPTFIWPQLVGGFLLGIGFIISGYCPGTSLVATASGKLDGLVALGGVAIGITLFGVTYTPAVQEFHTSGSYGRVLLSDLFGIEPTVLSLIITVAAVVCFVAAHYLEKQFAHLANGVAPTCVPRLRYASFAILVFAAVLFALPFTPYEQSAEASVQVRSIAPLELAQSIVEGNREATVVDVRQNAGGEQIFPGSVNVTAGEGWESVKLEEMLPSSRTIVLLTESGSLPEGLRIPSSLDVEILKGGYAGWKEEILSEPQLPENPTDEQRQQHSLRSAMYAYFTGAALEAPTPSAPLPTFKPSGNKKKKPAGGC